MLQHYDLHHAVNTIQILLDPDLIHKTLDELYKFHLILLHIHGKNHASHTGQSRTSQAVPCLSTQQTEQILHP